MNNTIEDQQIAQLRQDVQHSLDEHKKWGSWDAYFYNGGTGIVLLCTTLATYLPDTQTQIANWLPQVLTAIATFWVALDRALTFGSRWRFHLSQKYGYRRILDRLSFYSTIPTPEREKHIKETLMQLDIVRSQESDMPGIGVTK